MKEYAWAANPAKLELSIATLRPSGDLSDEAVKAEYVRRGGLVLNPDGSKGESFAEKIETPAPEEVPEEEKFAGTTDDIPAAPTSKPKKAKKK